MAQCRVKQSSGRSAWENRRVGQHQAQDNHGNGGNPGHDAKHAEIEASTPAPLKSTRAAAPLLTSALRLHQRETHRVPLRHPPSSPRYTLQRSPLGHLLWVSFLLATRHLLAEKGGAPSAVKLGVLHPPLL